MKRNLYFIVFVCSFALSAKAAILTLNPEDIKAECLDDIGKLGQTKLRTTKVTLTKLNLPPYTYRDSVLQYFTCSIVLNIQEAVAIAKIEKKKILFNTENFDIKVVGSDEKLSVSPGVAIDDLTCKFDERLKVRSFSIKQDSCGKPLFIHPVTCASGRISFSALAVCSDDKKGDATKCFDPTLRVKDGITVQNVKNEKLQGVAQ